MQGHASPGWLEFQCASCENHGPSEFLFTFFFASEAELHQANFPHFSLATETRVSRIFMSLQILAL